MTDMIARELPEDVTRCQRPDDLARAAIGADPGDGPVEWSRSTSTEALKGPPAGGIDPADLWAKAGVSDRGRPGSSRESTRGLLARSPPTA
jgi:hypothetical protein